MRKSTRLQYVPPTAAGLVAVMLTAIVIRYPDHAFEASVDGLRLWFEIVLPALLPFFVLSEILLGLGVISAMGVLLEPLMRPVFRIPGEAAFTLAMGLASGYPLGAKLTGRMRKAGICTREEGERLVAFANTADPLFMIGAVAFGMFGSATLGTTIAVSHYLAAFVVGFLMRYHAGGRMARPKDRGKGSYISRAAMALVEQRRRDGRPIGTLFSDAVRDSMASMLFVGGTIMMFSVFLRIVEVSGLGALLAHGVGGLLAGFGLDSALATAMINGLMEITLGARTAAEAGAHLLDRLIIAGFIIGWSGFSVHAQVAAMLHGTDIRLAPYIVARLLHGVIAGLSTWALYPLLGELPASLSGTSRAALPYMVRLGWVTGSAVILLAGLAVLSALIIAFSRIRISVFRV